tara:strand:+ start:746 stop:1573 length:828 start_codon:yes stop_codon:yes gene_type:complete
MMRRNILINFYALLVMVPITLFGNRNGPPTGYAYNAPNYNNCTVCHSGTPNSGDGSIEFINLPDEYVTGETYSIGVIVTGSNREGYGFQATAMAGDQFAGSFNLNSSSEYLELNGNYIQHNSRNPSGIWYFNWDAPEESTETITFSASGLGTGGSSGYSGDRVYTIQVEIQPQSVGISSKDPLIPFSLNGNYPNPFNGETIISYVIPNDGFVNISIFNVTGQFITNLVNDYQLYGEKKVFWDTKDATGNHVPSGIYYYVVSNGKNKEARTMTLLK